MPARDKTGPLGRGPFTGRGFGPCGSGVGPEFGRGVGRGFGFRRFAPVTQPVELSKEEQIKILEEQRNELETRLKELKDAKA